MGSLTQKKQTILNAFKCQGSGNCCRYPGYVYVSHIEQEKMAKRLGLSLTDFQDRFTQSERGWRVVASPTFRPTCFLDPDQRCSVYSVRPSACRTYPDWPELWVSDETILQEAQTCPGLNQALKKLQLI